MVYFFIGLLRHVEIQQKCRKCLEQNWCRNVEKCREQNVATYRNFDNNCCGYFHLILIHLCILYMIIEWSKASSHYIHHRFFVNDMSRPLLSLTTLVYGKTKQSVTSLLKMKIKNCKIKNGNWFLPHHKHPEIVEFL